MTTDNIVTHLKVLKSGIEVSAFHHQSTREGQHHKLLQEQIIKKNDNSLIITNLHAISSPYDAFLNF